MTTEPTIPSKLDSLREKSSKVFSSVPQSTAHSTTAIGISVPTNVLFWPTEEVAAQKKIDYIVYLMTSSISGDSSIVAWKSWVYSLFSLAYPSVGTAMSGNTIYVREQLTAADIDKTILAIDNYCNSDTGVPADYGLSVKPGMPDWENSSGTYNPSRDAWAANSEEAVYSFLALLVYLMGKRITVDNLEDFTKKRPGNLIQKAHLEDEAYFLTGQGALGEYARNAVTRVWVTAPHFRKIVVDLYMSFEGRLDPISDIGFTIFNLLKWSQMNFTNMIDKMLADLDWVYSIAELRSEWDFYESSIDALDKFPASQQPYVKLLYGEKFIGFRRNRIPRLIACAVTYGLLTDENLKNFRTPAGTEGMISRFRDMLYEHRVVVEAEEQ